MYKDSPRRFERYLLRLLSRLPFLPDRLLRRLAPDLHRRRKEQWEFEWQTKQWASLYHDSGTKAKVLEYWNRFRFLSEIRRVLKPGGHFVLTCETFAADVGKRNIGHAHSLALKTLLGLLHGFEMVDRWKSPWIGLRG